MVGFGDLAFRAICRRMGSAYSYLPMTPDEAVIHRARRGEPPVLFGQGERPVAVQLLSKDEGRLAQAGRLLGSVAPDILDINMGCPARRVSGRGRGAGLLKDPDKIGRMVRGLVEAVPMPITAKIRLGWDEDTRNYVTVARILVESGASAIAVHGRTRDQGYGERADWGAIAEVVASVDVPVLANGDVWCQGDIDAIKRTTGCAAVLIGRGAVGNPWIFCGRDVDEVSYQERVSMIEHHTQAMVEHYGERPGIVLFRKHVVKYLKGLDGVTAFRLRLTACASRDELLRALADWRPSPCPAPSQSEASKSHPAS